VSLGRFQHFISTNFTKLCADHDGANQVLFTLTTNNLGKVEILAQARDGRPG
jgi:hypothetical protein